MAKIRLTNVVIEADILNLPQTSSTIGGASTGGGIGLAPNSVRIGCAINVDNPEMPVSELEPLIDQALKRAKSQLLGDLLPPSGPGGASGGDQCRPHDKTSFDKSRTPT